MSSDLVQGTARPLLRRPGAAQAVEQAQGEGVGLPDEIYVTTYNIDNSLIYEMDNVENYEFINQKWKEIKEKGNDII